MMARDDDDLSDGASQMSSSVEESSGVEAGGGANEEAFISADELKRTAAGEMADAEPCEMITMKPLPGFAWRSTFVERAAQQERALVEATREQNRPYFRPPYCYMCETYTPDGQENDYQKGILELISQCPFKGMDYVVYWIYRYYDTHVRPLTRKEWTTEMIQNHILYHAPDPLILLCHQEHILYRSIDSQVQQLVEDSTRDQHKKDRTRMLNNTLLFKFMQQALRVHTAKHQFLKSTASSGGIGSNSGKS